MNTIRKNSNITDKLLFSLLYSILSVFVIACIFPFLLVIMTSITDEVTLLRDGYKLFPSKYSYDAYKVIFQGITIYKAYYVTVFVTVIGTFLSMLITSACAYAVSVKELKYRNVIMFYIWITMLFNGGLVPWYILISKYLHMSNTIWSMIIPVLVSPWNLFLLRNFFKSIPDSLAESAKIDGANDIYILFRIILPLSLPGLATVGLFYALSYWNQWYTALMFIDNPDLYPLQFIIMRIIRNMTFTSQTFAQSVGNVTIPAYTIRMATVVVTIGPIILLYPFVQKYFIKGMTVGAVKG
jgi:multiple sugar transport system permease protein/putative aldouronate transport system permease protein